MKSESSQGQTLHRQQHNCNVPRSRIARTSGVQQLFYEATRILFVSKENKNKDFVQQFFSSSSRLLCGKSNVIMTHALASVSRCVRFHQKYLNLCSEDEGRSYGFKTT